MTRLNGFVIFGVRHEEKVEQFVFRRLIQQHFEAGGVFVRLSTSAFDRDGAPSFSRHESLRQS